MTERGPLACAVALAAAVSLFACQSKAPPTAVVSHAPLGPDVVARVGRDPGATSIVASLVAAVSTEASVPPPEALGRLVDDALGAQGALAEGLASRPDVAFRLRAARGRAAILHFRADAVAAGPPGDAEVATLTARHWKEVALPPQARVVHAVVVARHDARDAANAPLARDLAAAEHDATSPEDFEARARAFAAQHPSVEIKVERLPPFTEDGRATAPGDDDAFDPTFARAALALGQAGAPITSGPVETPFGLHVIRLIERLPEKQVPLEARRTAFREEATNERIRKSIDALGAGVIVEVASDVDGLLRTLAFPGGTSPR